MATGQDYYGKTIADAIANACKELAASQGELDIEVLETGSSGIFGLCRKKAHIRVARKEKEPPAAAQAAEPTPKKSIREKKKKAVEPEAKPVSETAAESAEEEREPEGLAEEGDAAKPEEAGPYVPPSPESLAALRNEVVAMLEIMECPSSVTVELEEQTVVCKIGGEHQSVLAGQEGRTLDSLQYLLRKMTSKLLPDRTKLSVEVGDYRERRIEELKKQVLELAAKVREDGMTQAIPALNPSERRVVHMVLQDDGEVRSRSVGEGLFKKVLIYKPGRKKNYSRKGQQGGDPAGS